MWPKPAFARPLIAVLLLALIAAVFAPGLHGGFLFDDYPTIVQEPKVQLEQLDWDELTEAGFAFHPEGGFPRPIAGITLALNHIGAGGLEPFSFKATNLAFHLLNCLLLFAWLKSLLSVRPIDASRSTVVAATISFIWAIHPLQVSTVLYVIQRMEMLWVTFALLALWQYTRGRLLQLAGAPGAMKHFVIAGLAIPLGLLAKESAALIPFLLVALECLVFRFEAVDRAWAKAWKVASWIGVFLGGAALSAITVRYAVDENAYATRDFTAAGRVLSQLEIVPNYLAMILWPRIDQMTFYYDQLVAPTHLTLSNAAGGLFLLALSVAAIWLRKRNPLFSLGTALFLLTHALTSTTIPLELAFEHRNYLALAGVLIALYGLLPSHVLNANRSMSAAVAVILAASFGSLTIARSATWGNSALLAHTLAEINPLSTRASMDLGEQYMLAANKSPASPWYPRAVAEFERASLLPQGSIMGEHGLLLMHADFGLRADAAWWARMENKLRSGPVRPQEVDAVTGMVEQRLKGLPLDGNALAQVTATMAKRKALSPELYALYGMQAYKDAGIDGPAAELFSLALTSPHLDEEFRRRIRQGIVNLGGNALLSRADKFSAEAKSSAN